MFITIDLPTELEQRITREAEERGVTVAEHILHVLSDPAPRFKTGAEIVAYWRRKASESECVSTRSKVNSRRNSGC